MSKYSENKRNFFKEVIAKNPENSLVAALAEVSGVSNGKGLQEVHPAKCVLRPLTDSKAANSQSTDNGPIAIYARTFKQQEAMNALFSLATTVVLDGAAGTGKTMLAVLYAIIHKELGLVDKIYFARHLLDKGSSIGFVPGGMNQKMAGSMRPLLQILVDLGREDLVRGIKDYKADSEGTIGDQLVEEINRDVEFLAMHDLKGRNLTNAFIILDEAEDCPVPMMYTALTRIAQGSRYVVCGDAAQAEEKMQDSNGMLYAIWKAHNYKARVRMVPGCQFISDLSGEGLPDNDEIAYVRFTSEDVVRHSAVRGEVESMEKFLKEKPSRQDILDLRDKA